MNHFKRRGKELLGVVVVFLLVSGAALAQPASTAATAVPAVAKESPLSNADVISIVKLGLGDEVAIAKIREAPAVDFKTDVDSLEELKAQGVSAAVITAMLQRETPPKNAAAQSKTAQEQLAEKTLGLFGPSGVLLCSKGHNYKLTSIAGSPSAVYAFFTYLLFADFPGRHASVRVGDSRPSILIHSENSPTGRYYFVRAKSNEKDDTRSVKLGRVHLFTAKSMTAPDKDWVVKASLKQESPEVWRLTPEENLKPGEYGLWELGLPQPEMYDFGIDK